MIALSQALSAALLHFIWQGTAVAFLLSIAFTLLRNRSANARYFAACAAMALTAALPVVTLCLAYRTPVAISGAVAFALPTAGHAGSASFRDWLSILAANARQWTLPLWTVGVTFFAMRLLLAWRHVTQLRRTAERSGDALAETAVQIAGRMRITRPVRVLMTALADSPSVVGWLRPAILMPAAAMAGLDAAQLEAILAHELAHIRRHDYLVNVLQTVVETLLFYHPAVWWVSSRMRHERELCCDDLAVRYSGDAVGYARALTQLERVRVVPGPALAANAGSLLYRIQRLTGAVRGSAPSRLPALLAAVVAAVLIPLTLHQAHAQTTPLDDGSHDPTLHWIQTPLERYAFRGLPDNNQPDNNLPDSIQPPYNKVEVYVVREGPEAGWADTTGSVLVEATLGGSGKVTDARVVTGPMELRSEALRLILDRSFLDATAEEVRQLRVDFAEDRQPTVRAIGPGSSGEPGTYSSAVEESDLRWALGKTLRYSVVEPVTQAPEILGGGRMGSPVTEETLRDIYTWTPIGYSARFVPVDDNKVDLRVAKR
jgi:beta-lactamase regulating signal transducer with metallopeptidase domain